MRDLRCRGERPEDETDDPVDYARTPENGMLRAMLIILEDNMTDSEEVCVWGKELRSVLLGITRNAGKDKKQMDMVFRRWGR